MSGFSLEGYRELLSAFKEAGYSFCTFEEINQRLTKGLPFVVLRHDIDISLHPALEIARIECEQGVQASYFVTLHSPFYNALSRSSAEIVLRVHQLGHQIALHVDLKAYDGDYVKALLEVDVFSKFYPYINTQIASLHSLNNLEQIPIDFFKQLHSVYSCVFSGNTAYISDSTGRWRYGHPLDSDAFHSRKPIQLLTHPIWWVQDGETATNKLESWLYMAYLNSLTAAEEFLPKLYQSSLSLQNR